MKPPRVIILILLVLDLYPGSFMLTTPLILPDQNEIVISAGDAIILECIFISKLFFYYPHYNEQDGQTIVVTQPKVEETKRNYRHKYVFFRYPAMPDNTGWYGCASLNITITSEVFDDPKFSWIYIYVSSPSQLLIEEGEFRNIIQTAGHSAILPCRPTSPDLKVVLYNEDTDEEVHIGENVTYDPRFGFKFKNVSIIDSNSFRCSTTMNGEAHSMTYQLLVQRNIIVDPPKIDNNALKHVVRGQNLHVNCTIRLDLYIFYILNWITPRQSFPITTQLYTNKIEGSSQEVVRELVIKNVSMEDEGEYTCYIETNMDRKETRAYLKVFDPDKKYMNLIPQNGNTYYQLPPGGKVKWVVMVDAYPEPKLKWLLPNGDQIIPSWSDKKYTMSRTPQSTILTICHLEIRDMGVYQLQGINGDDKKSLHITLEVLDKPFLKLKSVERYYAPGQNIHIQCEVLTFSRPNITCYFQRYSHYLFEDGSSLEELKSEIIQLETYSYLLNASMEIDNSGIINCTACNSIGCNYVSSNIYVSDGNGDFNILEPKEQIIEGDRIVIICAASIYNYTNNITWTKGDDNKPIVDNGNISVVKQKTSFTYRSILSIQPVRKEDRGIYTCTAKTTNGVFKSLKYNLLVNARELSKELISMVVILFIIVVVLVVYVKIKIRREKILRKELLKTGLMNFDEGALECLNPALTVDDQAELLPYDKKWEFPRERLKLGEKLGSGAFGVVMMAEAYGICKDETITTVAVKMVRRATDLTYVRALVGELKIMVHLGKHLNVVNLLGACTKNISKRELLVIVEYCRFGNLHNYLLKHRMNFISQIDPATGKFDFMIGSDLLTQTTSVTGNNSISANSTTKTINRDTRNTSDSTGVTEAHRGSNYRGDYNNQNVKPICTQDLLSWAFQVARGMEYLAQRKVLHGDLAARNILLAEDNIVKICDFGLAKTMYKDGNYKKKGNEPLPIKWMAIESIRDRVFSTQSDIWSFGIVLWELFTLAETPYPGMEVEKQYEKLREGYRMEQPAYATNEVYQIMLQCWKAEPTLRPNFRELVDSIGDLLEESVKAHYISLNTPYMHLNAILEGKNDYLAMMSAPNHTVTSSFTHDYMNSPNKDNLPESAYLRMSARNPKKE